MEDTVTVTFRRADYYEVCNLLQLMAVFGVRLWMDGPHPDQRVLARAFDDLTKAGLKRIEEDA